MTISQAQSIRKILKLNGLTTAQQDEVLSLAWKLEDSNYGKVQKNN